MSTFVIRLVDGSPESFKGKIRHVTSGEEVVFSSISEMVSFVEGMAAMKDAGSMDEELSEASSEKKPESRRGPDTNGG